MPVVVADFNIIYSRVVDAINAAESGTRAEYADGAGDLDDRAREITLIRDAILACDARKRKDICEDERNSHRPGYLEFSDELEHGAELPDRYGPVGAVVIKPYDGGEYGPGIDLLALGHSPAQAREMIRQWRANAGGVFGALAHNAAGSPLAGCYVITGSRVEFTGHRLKAEVANAYAVDRDAAPSCVSPSACENDIVADSVAWLMKQGEDTSEGSYFRGLKLTSPQP